MTAQASPYKGLAPFDDSEFDVQFFFGRDREREVIAGNLMAARLTVLYGESGVGKSSVLRAGVVHRLRNLPEPHGVVLFDSWQDDPAPLLRAAIGDACGLEPVGTLTDTLALAAARLGGEVFVVLDQIEEYFLYHPSEQGIGSFFEEFSDAVTRPEVRASFLVSLREDAVAKLDRFKARIPNLFGNFLRLEHLDRPSARQAIVGPVERYNALSADGTVRVEPELVEAVLDEVAAGRVELAQAGVGTVAEPSHGDRVEAPYLQLVMERIWQAEQAAGSSVLRLSTLRNLGGAEQIVRDHLDDAVETLSPDQKDVAAEIFDHLVTPSGTKIAHDPTDLARYARVDEPELEPVLSTLARKRILRTVAGSGGSEVARYEIYHDVLADSVLGWKAAHESMRELERERTSAERRHRRLLVVVGAALLALLVMAGVTVFALTQRSDARRQTRRAKAGELAQTALTDLSVDPEESVRLALQAANLQPSVEHAGILRSAVAAFRLDAVLPGGGGALGTAVFSPGGALVLTVSRTGKARLFRARSGTLARELRDSAGVNAATFSPDGRLVATADRDGRARLWNARTGQVVREFRHGSRALADASFSVDGRRLVTAGDDRSARVWQTGTGRLVSVLHHQATVRRASFSPDGRRVVTVSGFATGPIRARVYDARDGRLVRVVPEKGIVTAGFSPDGKLVVTTSTDKTARLWDAKSGALRHVLPHQDHVVRAAFSPDGKLLLTASDDGTAGLWDVATGARIILFVGGTNLVKSAAFSPDGKLVVVASLDRTARIYNTSDGRQKAVLLGHRGGVTDARFSPDGRQVLTASEDGTARIWDPGTEDQLEVVGRHEGPVVSAGFSPDGRLVVSASADGTARIWDWKRRRQLRILRHGGAVRAAAFSPNGRLVATGSDDSTAGIWSVATGRELHVLRNRGPVGAVAFSRDGRLVVTGSDDSTAGIWSVATGRELHVLRNGGPVHAVAFSPDGKLVGTGGDDQTARLWQVASGRQLHVLRHRGAVARVSFSPDGRLVLTASGDNLARLWQVDTGTLLHRIVGHTQAVRDAEFSRSGGLVVTASDDHDARIVVTATGRLAHLLRGHFTGVQTASFSPDGRWVVTAAALSGGLWQTATGRLFAPTGLVADPFLRGTDGPLTGASFGPDGRHIVTSSLDGTVRVFDCTVCGTLPELVRIARSRLEHVRGHA